MPDDNQQTTDAVAPAFDMDALASQVVDKLKTSFAQEPPTRYQPPVQPTQTQNQDPVGELVEPYVRPHVERAARMASLAEEAASDAVEFYGSHPDIEPEARKEIERRFKAMKANGVPFKREDIYNHYIGENVDKVVERKIKAREEAAARAANASATVGAGSPDKSVRITDPYAMPTDALEKALEGISF